MRMSRLSKREKVCLGIGDLRHIGKSITTIKDFFYLEKYTYYNVWPSRFICMIPFTAIATASCLAPRIEMYTRLACEVYKPEYTDPRDPDFFSFGITPVKSDGKNGLWIVFFVA